MIGQTFEQTVLNAISYIVGMNLICLSLEATLCLL